MINFRSFAFTSALAIGCAVEPPSTQPDATTQFTDVPDASITPDKATNTPDVLTPLHEPPSITLQDQHSGTAFPGTWVHLTGTATGHGSAVHQFEPSTELSELTTSSRTDQGNMSGIWRFRIPCNTTPGRQQFTFTAVDADGFHSEASIEIDVRALDSNGTNEISRPITLCTESGDQVSTSFHISANDIRFDAHETSFYPNTTISIGNPTGTIYDTTLTGLGVVQGLITAQNVGRLTISGGSFRPRATEPALVISHSFQVNLSDIYAYGTRNTTPPTTPEALISLHNTQGGSITRLTIFGSPLLNGGLGFFSSRNMTLANTHFSNNPLVIVGGIGGAPITINDTEFRSTPCAIVVRDCQFGSVVTTRTSYVETTSQVCGDASAVTRIR